jgi:superfamily II DNA/RNA helicase
VLFHGGVPGDKRGALVDRFNNDPACRVFLSTDAGGVGLNLQHAAAVVVNMDLPWNPAVLEQRIGRVHRLGQTRGVQVINFVARGTIEEGMLSVLAFKQSLFAGILDGGESEVVLQGTRLSKFMETVEQVSGAAESSAPMDEPSEDTLPLDATAAAGSEKKPTARQNTGSRRPRAKRASRPLPRPAPRLSHQRPPRGSIRGRRSLGAAAGRRRAVARRADRGVKRRTRVALGADRLDHRPALPQASRPRPADRPAPRRRPAESARREKVANSAADGLPGAHDIRRSPIHRAIDGTESRSAQAGA